MDFEDSCTFNLKFKFLDLIWNLNLKLWSSGFSQKSKVDFRASLRLPLKKPRSIAQSAVKYLTKSPERNHCNFSLKSLTGTLTTSAPSLRTYPHPPRNYRCGLVGECLAVWISSFSKTDSNFSTFLTLMEAAPPMITHGKTWNILTLPSDGSTSRISSKLLLACLIWSRFGFNSLSTFWQASKFPVFSFGIE